MPPPMDRGDDTVAPSTGVANASGGNATFAVAPVEGVLAIPPALAWVAVTV